MDAESVLTFWFGELDADGLATPQAAQRWWTKDAAFDAEVRERFGTVLSALLAGQHRDWLDTPRGRLAYVIVLDQFSRNIHRGSARAFEADALALEVARAGVERGDDQALRGHERVFLYMPFMHSEALADQERCVSLFRALCDSSSGAVRATAENNLDFAIQHRDIIARWGRFPHRNDVLGRPSSDAERAFLQQPGSSF